MCSIYDNAQKEYDIFIRDFLTEMGMRCLAQTKKLTPVDTGRLRETWEISDVNELGSYLYISIFNNTEYASWVEDGHKQKHRFVPGSFLNGKFEYIPNYPTGMVLSDKYIPGEHMARISIEQVERNMPRRFNIAFKQFMASLGGD